MITKNYYKILAAAFGTTTSLVSYKTYNNTEKAVSTTNLIYHLMWNTRTYDYASIANLRESLTSYGGVILGTGDTPPTFDDYKLAGDIISGFVYTSTLSANSDENGVTLKAKYTITNNNASEITIKELGLINGMGGSTFTASEKGLLDRTVLDNPVTIPAGGVGQVEYTITFNLPTA